MPHYVPLAILELSARFLVKLNKPTMILAATPAEQQDWSKYMHLTTINDRQWFVCR